MWLWDLGTRKGPGLQDWPPPGKHSAWEQKCWQSYQGFGGGHCRQDVIAPPAVMEDDHLCLSPYILTLNVHFFVIFQFKNHPASFSVQSLIHATFLLYHLLHVITVSIKSPRVFCSYERRKTINVFFKWKWKHQNTEFRQNQMQQEWLSNLNKAFSLWLCLWL